MKAKAKETCRMNDGSVWISKGKEYKLKVVKYQFIDETGDNHNVSADRLSEFFDVNKGPCLSPSLRSRASGLDKDTLTQHLKFFDINADEDKDKIPYTIGDISKGVLITFTKDKTSYEIGVEKTKNGQIAITDYFRYGDKLTYNEFKELELLIGMVANEVGKK